jgi:hypothetical protein
VTYYVSAATVEAESRTADIVAAVVTDTGRCPAGSRVAPVCPCASPVAAFLPGGVASVPAGFSGVAGAVAGASTAANIAAAVAIGLGAVGIGILIGDTSPASASR